MSKTKIFYPIIFLLTLIATSLLGAEGMWPIYDLDKIPFEKMKDAGLELKKQDIFNPDGVSLTDAIVNISGGSSSFVSKDGLVITNHHVAIGAVQKQSTTENNYVADGFYAATKEEEIPALGFNIYVILNIEDKTSEVLTVVDDGMSDLERHDAIESKIKEIVKKAENGKDVKCTLEAMFEGRQYVLYTYFEIRDIRIVYAPPYSIGNYGGDIDNWMWPRHVGDFAFVRTYVAPDGSSADYSKDNVPYHPKNFLVVSSNGVKEGDFTMMMGFPGRTTRYSSSFRVDFLLNKYYPLYLKTARHRLDLIEKESAKDEEVALRLMSKASGINNFYKKTLGMVEGFKRVDIVNKKKNIEKELTRFILNNPELKDSHGSLFGDLEKLYEEDNKNYRKDFILDYSVYASDYLKMVNRIYKWSIEQEKADLERERGYQERDRRKILRGLENDQINLIPTYDKQSLEYFILEALKLPETQRIKGIDTFFGKDSDSSTVRTLLDKMYNETKIGDLDSRLEYFEKSADELRELDDPFIDFAVAMRGDLDDLILRTKEFDGALSRLNPKLINAYVEWKDGALYPDANGTLRFNYGEVKGFSPRDAVEYDYYTTLKGVMEKETGEDPFIVPEELKQAYINRDFGKYFDSTIGDIPVNFITTNSGTNGSSGSAVMNARGELLGLDFDTGFEGVSADYMYNPDVCRAVITDMRYVLFLIDHVYNLENLVNELTIH